MANHANETDAIDPEKHNPFALLDGRNQSNTTGESLVTIKTLRDADEALCFLENHPRSAQIAEEGNAILEDPQQLKKLVRKIDLTIAPLLACVYFLQFLDKTTLSYTAVMGIRTDTHLKGQNYSNLSMLFYIGTAYPILIIAMWYKKNEQGRRVSWFYVCNSLTQIFGGCVAYGVSFASTGFATWRIFYIAIGALTMVVGALVAVFLPDSPVKARRFTDAEKVAALMRSLILTAPTGAIGAVVVLLIGYLSDKWRDRSLVMIIVIIPTILSGCLMIGLDPNGIPKNKGGLLAASFLSGTFGAAFMLLLAWNASNIAGHSKKVTANALTLVAFAVGNILGTQTFQQKEAPGYKSGKISIIATLSALILVVIVLRLYNDHLNKVNEKRLADVSEGEKDELKEKLAASNITWPLQAHLDDEHDTFVYKIPYSNIDVDFIIWLEKPVDRQSLGLAILSGQRYIRNRIISQGEGWIQAEDDPFLSIIPDHIWLRNDSAKTSSGRSKMTYVTLLRVYEAYMKVLYEGKMCLEASMQTDALKASIIDWTHFVEQLLLSVQPTTWPLLARLCNVLGTVRFVAQAAVRSLTAASSVSEVTGQPTRRIAKQRKTQLLPRLRRYHYKHHLLYPETQSTRLGNFYDHQGADSWYYYVYGQSKGKSGGKKKDEAVSKACGCDVYGDAAVSRSGPGGESIPENFTSVVLAKALAFYETNSSSAVIAEREKREELHVEEDEH
ncbi:MAG: hypothetical protein Q9203_001484 [Teloschistes exilis]